MYLLNYKEVQPLDILDWHAWNYFETCMKKNEYFKWLKSTFKSKLEKKFSESIA